MKKSRRRSEAEVAEYWLTHDSIREVDWASPGARLEFDPDVERPTQPVTVRLPRLVRVGKRLVARPTIAAAKLPRVDFSTLVAKERARRPR